MSVEEDIDLFRANCDMIAFKSGWTTEYVQELELLTIRNIINPPQPPQRVEGAPGTSGKEFEEKIKQINQKIHEMKKQGQKEAY
ncbi:MAG TPA: hypothetical protein VGC02_04905 [Methanobacterium sp.]